MTQVLTATLFGVPLSVLVMGLVYVCEQNGLPSRFAPDVAIAFGILAGLAYEWQGPDSNHNWLEGIVYGVVVALVASGIWSQAKARIDALQFTRPQPPPAP